MRGRQSESDAFSVGEHCKSSTSALLPYPDSSHNRLLIFSLQSLIPQRSRPYVPALEAAGYKLTIQEPDCHQHPPFKGPDININLHVFTTGSTEIDRVLMLRDWPQKNPSDPISTQRTRRATTQLTTTTAKVAQLPSRITTPAFHLQSSHSENATYNWQDSAKTVTVPNGNPTTYVYDYLGRLVKTTNSRWQLQDRFVQRCCIGRIGL
jgi:YD repeat-containing protein